MGSEMCIRDRTIIKNLQLIVDETGCYMAAISGFPRMSRRLPPSAIPYELRDNRRPKNEL